VSCPVLIGRERELGALVEAVADPPASVTVIGEAGIGKSRLVGELLADRRIAGRWVLLGRCHQLRDPFPLGPVIEALRGAAGDLPAVSLSPVVGALRPLLPELGRCLPEQPEPLVDPRAQRHRIFRAFRELLAGLGPTVCVLEDLHWADGETLELLSFLLSEPPSRLALVLTYRSEEVDAGRPIPVLGSGAAMRRRTIALTPLSVDEVGALAAELLESEQVPKCSARYLHARSDGIPFAVEEVVGLLDDRGELSLLVDGCASELEELGVPPALRLWVLERIARLSADARSVACAAAVVGRPASEALLRTVAGLPAARANRAVSEGLRGGVLAEQGGAVYGFRHALAAQAVYEDIPTPERQRLHRRAGRALESLPEPRPLTQITHHFKEAGRRRQWTRYAEAAAQAAHAVGDDRSAAELLEQALQAPGLSRTARVRMAIALGNAALYSPSPQTAIAALERALDAETLSTVPTGVRGELRFSLCRLRFHAGQTNRWREEMLLAVQELRRRPELVARAMVNLALPSRFTEVDLTEHFDWLCQAEQAASRQDDPVARIAVAAQRATILLEVGDPAGWDAIGNIPAGGGSVDEKLQLLRGYRGLSWAALGLGHYRRADSFLTEAERIHTDLDYEDWSDGLTTLRASLDGAVGRWEGLEFRVRGCGHDVLLAGLLLARGELAEAQSRLESALEVARAGRWIPGLADATGTLARLFLQRGDPPAARWAAAEGMRVVRCKGIWVWATAVAPQAVDAFLACDEHEAAAELVRELADGLRGRDAPAAQAALACCQGALSEVDGRYELAARYFAQAEHGWRALPRPYEAARVRARRARCLLRSDDRRGGELLLGALEEFEALGASWDGARVRAALRAERVVLPYPWRGGRRTYGDDLSPREAEVARAAATGKTNGEIAEALVLSPHTVAHHMSSALRKLRVNSRKELAEMASKRAASQN